MHILAWLCRMLHNVCVFFFCAIYTIDIIIIQRWYSNFLSFSQNKGQNTRDLRTHVALSHRRSTAIIPVNGGSSFALALSVSLAV